MRALIAAALLSSMVLSSAWGAIIEKEVEYRSGDVNLKGFVAYDDASAGKRPAVLVVHEWWGHDQHARNSAHKLAEAGYVGFALDMYGEGKHAHHPDDAGKFSSEVTQNLPLMKARFDAARDYLKTLPNVDTGRIAAVGYCFGGSVVLQMARDGEDLRGVVSFHGGLATQQPAQSGKVKAKVLVLTGGADPYVPKEQVEAFEKEMKAAAVDYKLVSYPGVKHSFTNPGSTALGKQFNMPAEYNADADRKSWAEGQAFLKKALQ